MAILSERGMGHLPTCQTGRAIRRLALTPLDASPQNC
jgi:hypothetical protein